MATDTSRYPYRFYNQHDVLRARWNFWLIVLFLARHLLLIVVVGLAHRRGGGAGAGDLVSMIDPVFIPSDIPALILLFTVGARVPASGGMARYLWRHGRMLILASIAIFLATLVWQKGLVLADYTVSDWLEIGFCAALVVYSFASRYLNDLFAQFPAPPAGKAAG